MYWFEFGSSNFFLFYAKNFQWNLLKNPLANRSAPGFFVVPKIWTSSKYLWPVEWQGIRNLILPTLISAVELNPSNWLRSSNMVLWTSLSPAFSESKRLVPIASNSSMKMIAGAFSLAKAKASRTSLAPSPVIRDRVLVFDCQAERLDFRVHNS